MIQVEAVADQVHGVGQHRVEALDARDPPADSRRQRQRLRTLLDLLLQCQPGLLQLLACRMGQRLRFRRASQQQIEQAGEDGQHPADEQNLDP